MESNDVPLDAAAARQALDQVHADRSLASPRLRVPLWYCAGLVLVVVSFFCAFVLDESTFTVAVSVSAAAAVLLGVLHPWVTRTQAQPWSTEAGLRGGLVQAAAVLVFGAAGIALFTLTGLGWVLWVTAVLAGVLCFGLSMRMETVFTRSIRQGSQ